MFSWLTSGSKTKYTVKHLKSLHAQLVKHVAEGGTAHEAQIVEILRSVSELMVYGDKHSERFFEFFCEHNMLGLFVRLMDGHMSARVKTQVIQTVSILVQNIQSETTLFYILSNNYVNQLIAADLDLEQEGGDELLAYYISFLKTLSLQLTDGTVHFFFNEFAAAGSEFPLYTSAIRFIEHPESMVRIASRTLTLNVFRLSDPAVARYVSRPPQSAFFLEAADYVRKQLDQLHEAAATNAVGRIDELSAEMQDAIYYLQDVLATGKEELAACVIPALTGRVLAPALVAPLLAATPREEEEEEAPRGKDQAPTHGAGTLQRPAEACMFGLANMLLFLTHHAASTVLMDALMRPPSQWDSTAEALRASAGATGVSRNASERLPAAPEAAASTQDHHGGSGSGGVEEAEGAEEAEEAEEAPVAGAQGNGSGGNAGLSVSPASRSRGALRGHGKDEEEEEEAEEEGELDKESGTPPARPASSGSVDGLDEAASHSDGGGRRHAAGGGGGALPAWVAMALGVTDPRALAAAAHSPVYAVTAAALERTVAAGGTGTKEGDVRCLMCTVLLLALLRRCAEVDKELLLSTDLAPQRMRATQRLLQGLVRGESGESGESGKHGENGVTAHRPSSPAGQRRRRSSGPRPSAHPHGGGVLTAAAAREAVEAHPLTGEGGDREPVGAGDVAVEAGEEEQVGGADAPGADPGQGSTTPRDGGVAAGRGASPSTVAVEATENGREAAAAPSAADDASVAAGDQEGGDRGSGQGDDEHEEAEGGDDGPAPATAPTEASGLHSAGASPTTDTAAAEPSAAADQAGAEEEGNAPSPAAAPAEENESRSAGADASAAPPASPAASPTTETSPASTPYWHSLVDSLIAVLACPTSRIATMRAAAALLIEHTSHASHESSGGRLSLAEAHMRTLRASCSDTASTVLAAVVDMDERVASEQARACGQSVDDAAQQRPWLADAGLDVVEDVCTEMYGAAVNGAGSGGGGGGGLMVPEDAEAKAAQRAILAHSPETVLSSPYALVCSEDCPSPDFAWPGGGRDPLRHHTRRWLVLRSVLARLSGKGTDALAPKLVQRAPTLREGERLELASNTHVMLCSLPDAATQRAHAAGRAAPTARAAGERGMIVLGSRWLVVVASESAQSLARGVARAVAPLHHTTAEVDGTNARALVLYVRSKRAIGMAVPTPAASGRGQWWRMRLLFDHPAACADAQRRVISNKKACREKRRQDVESGLGDV